MPGQRHHTSQFVVNRPSSEMEKQGAESETPTREPLAHVQQPTTASHALTSRSIMNLQRTIGNRAVVQLVGNAAQQKAVPLARISESPHYEQSRDEEHSKAKAALNEADSEWVISTKIYNKHRTKKHSGKCVTAFKTSDDGFLVVVTYANLERGILTYDTAYFSRNAPAASEHGAIMFSPDKPVFHRD